MWVMICITSQLEDEALPNSTNPPRRKVYEKNMRFTLMHSKQEQSVTQAQVEMKKIIPTYLIEEMTQVGMLLPSSRNSRQMQAHITWKPVTWLRRRNDPEGPSRTFPD